jgi:undecaprenyl diphosphate synthase
MGKIEQPKIVTAVRPVPVIDCAPNHVAIIMDGNGRWASKRNLPRIAGHKKGMDSVRTVVETCLEVGVKYLTLYAFSSENWKRPVDEVSGLMGLLRLYVINELDSLDKQGVRLRFIGRLDGLSQEIQNILSMAEEKSKNNSKLSLNIALNYGGRGELLDAFKTIIAKVDRGEFDVNDLDEETISKQLYTHDIPDPDMVIRTSGEERLSNFLLWQSAYAELIFVEELWPDFDKICLLNALQTFSKRERRFGASL